MAASTISTVAYIYKRLYAKKVGESSTRKHALWSMVSKRGGFTGSAFFYSIRYGNPQGVSSTIASAISAVSSSKGVQLQASRKKKYGYITLDGEAMAAAENDEGAFLRLVTTETDGVIEEFVDSLAFDAYRDGTGIRGRRSSASTNVITLTIADEARNFKVGMAVAAGTSTTSLRTITGTVTVTAVDEDAGTVTLSDASAIASFSDNDYLFRLGDTGNVCMEGLAALFPLTAPAPAESFRGIDRSVDPARLAGSRVDDSGSFAEETIGLLAVKISQRGKKANVALLNPVKFWEVVKRLNAKVTYDGGGNKATFGFEGIDIATPAGTVRVISDADCPTNRVYVGDLSVLYIKHLKELPHIVMDDGNKSLRLTSEDSVEARVRCWSNMICEDPAAWGVGSV